MTVQGLNLIDPPAVEMKTVQKGQILTSEVESRHSWTGNKGISDISAITYPQAAPNSYSSLALSSLKFCIQPMPIYRLGTITYSPKYCDLHFPLPHYPPVIEKFCIIFNLCPHSCDIHVLPG